MAKKKVISAPSLFENAAPSTQTLQQIVDDRDAQPPVEEKEKAVETNPKTIPLATQEAMEGTQREVALRDGSILSVGEEATVHPGILTGLLKEAHEGKTFIIEKMTEWPNCESGALVIAYQKNDSELKTTGIGGKGIDANWFKKLVTQNS